MSVKFTASTYVNRKGEEKLGLQVALADTPTILDAIAAGPVRDALDAAIGKALLNAAEQGRAISDPRKPARKPRARTAVEVADEAIADARPKPARKTTTKPAPGTVRVKVGTKRIELPPVEAPAATARPRVRGRARVAK